MLKCVLAEHVKKPTFLGKAFQNPKPPLAEKWILKPFDMLILRLFKKKKKSVT